MIQLLIQSSLETLFMVAMATFFGVALGIPLGVFLFATASNSLCPSTWLNRSVGFIVNAIRSTPYIIFVVALIPLTRLLVGTSIGTVAATVPLSLAAVMLYCRSVEDALRNVPKGLIEAAHSLGATRLQIIYKILIPEALPSLVSNLTFIVITLVGFSAMAGAVGGGGLGDLGIRYGYQRYDLPTIIAVVILLILLVQIIQTFGDFITKKLKK